MNKKNWRFLIKIAGIIICIITFITLAVVIYLNRLEPLPFDAVMRDFCYDIRGEKYGFGYWFFRIITEFGNFYVVTVIVLTIIILTKGDFRAFIISVGILGAVLLNIGLKSFYVRERPYAEFQWMYEETTSFPSGHSTAAGFLYSFIIYMVFHTKLSNTIKNTTYVSCVVITLLVMFSRLILGVHYFSDVIAGFCVGIIVSCLCMVLYKVCEHYKIMNEGLFTIISRSKKEQKQENNQE